MKPPRNLLICALALLAGLGAGAAIAFAGGPGTPKLSGAKQKDGPYKPELRVNVADGARNVFVRVKSTHDSSQLATIVQDVFNGTAEDYTLRWFRGDVNISHDVQTSGYEFTLKPDRPKLFRVKVKANQANPDTFCLSPNVQVDEPDTGTNGPLVAVNGPLTAVCAV